MYVGVFTIARLRSYIPGTRYVCRCMNSAFLNIAIIVRRRQCTHTQKKKTGQGNEKSVCANRTRVTQSLVKQVLSSTALAYDILSPMVGILGSIFGV